MAIIRMAKVTPTVCVDGKRHHWTTIQTRGIYSPIFYVCWCDKCGSLTEFIERLTFWERPRRDRRVNKDGSYYIQIPSTIDTVPKKYKKVEWVPL